MSEAEVQDNNDSKQPDIDIINDFSNKFNFCIDRGGTFTDVYCELPKQYHKQNGSPYSVMKLLSVDPAYPDAPREGIRRILSQFVGKDECMTKDKCVDSSNIGFIRMGTTVATNALLERNGEPTALIITQGFRDLLHIGNQSRPKIFDLKITRPEVLYSRVYELNERIRINRQMSQETIDASSNRLVLGTTNEEIEIEKEPNKDEIIAILNDIAKNNIKSIAVVCLHSYTYNKHEKIVQQIAESMNYFNNISLSSELMAMVKIVPRGQTTCADAYLTPCIKTYIDQFVSRFDNKFSENVRLSFMQSDGGLCLMDHFCGYRAVLSGPAGGVVGYVQTTYNILNKKPVIGFDMGGTSTDVSRYNGEYEHVFENTTAGVTIQAPQLDIHTVAAGGGSILEFKLGMYHVGPKSVGAHPGPVCYKKQNNLSLNERKLSVTDANLILGRIVPDFFPKIFGKNRNESLGIEESKKVFEIQMNLINEKESRKLTIPEIALGYISVANETMCRPIRALTMAKGYDAKDHVLSCFGGAGGQHACAVARSLGIHKVLIHRFSGILSAYGMGLADVVHEKQEAYAVPFGLRHMRDIQLRLNSVCAKSKSTLLKDGFIENRITLQPFINLRFRGTNTAIFIPGPMDSITTNTDQSTKFNESELKNIFQFYHDEFLNRYKREYGFLLKRDILVDDIRCRGIAKSITTNSYNINERPQDKPLKPVLSDWQAWFDVPVSGVKGFTTPVFQYSELYSGDIIKGPSLIQQNTSTIVIEPNCEALIDKYGNIIITVGESEPLPVTTELDRIQLSIFGHRFMSIAEQMGRTLQRTSVSTNIKERLDFSCAIFGPDGSLVANAPHLPVHLGSMQEAVKYQINKLGDDINEGDVLVSNHPCAGGTHLPDITVITPVFASSSSQISLSSNNNPNHSGHSRDNSPIPSDNYHNRKPVFWVASRGHHADIGGIAPGSMPPFSTFLYEEGAAIDSLKLVRNHEFNEMEISKILTTPNIIGKKKNPNCVGTRNLSDNLSDLRAQVAANQKGIILMKSLINEYSLEVVQAYMMHIQNNAEQAVRSMLINVAQKYRNINSSSLNEASNIQNIKTQENLFDPSLTDGLGIALAPKNDFYTIKRKSIEDIDLDDNNSNHSSNNNDCDNITTTNNNNNDNLEDEKKTSLTPTTNIKYSDDDDDSNEEEDISRHRGRIRQIPEQVPQSEIPLKRRNSKTRNEIDFKNTNKQFHETILAAVDYMDDGTPIKVSITINDKTGNAIFDFDGTGSMVYGNCNAPPAVTYSAIIYCMRCLVDLDIPLNQGCLKPIRVKIPENSILCPSKEAAIVGGNVLTSQRITDVILKAFNVCGASQGCMNNLTFGDKTFGYYETIAGGSGAGPNWNGQSGVHTHMTNTRITDPEILERRYPVVLREFSLRKNSGGIGKYNGGNGCIRSIEFCRPLLVSILSERRTYKPYGLNGATDGKCGVNLIRRSIDGVLINIGSKRSYKASTGDIIHVITPGAGGFGKKDNSNIHNNHFDSNRQNQNHLFIDSV